MCEKCKDSGFVLVMKDGYEVAMRCDCYEKSMSLLRLKNSGISEEFLQKGFNEFDCKGIASLQDAKEIAIQYYQNFLENETSRQNSIVFCGQPGSGKTHLGMAICNNLLNVCHVGVTYMAYRNAITRIKQVVRDKEDYYTELNPYCNARLLYIDDLFKGNITEADLNIIYELVNFRYMNNKPMIISTEKLQGELVDIDEAIGSRILEMCRGNIVKLQGKELNYRLR